MAKSRAEAHPRPFIHYRNRTGRYRISAYLFVLLAFFFIHVLSLTGVGSPSRMFYISVALLISAILLPLRTTIILCLTSIGIQGWFAIFAPPTA